MGEDLQNSHNQHNTSQTSVAVSPITTMAVAVTALSPEISMPPPATPASLPIYTPSEAQIRRHPDVAVLIARDPVCASMLEKPSVRIWAPPPTRTDEKGNRSVRLATNKLFARTLNTADTIEHFFLFWDETRPDLFPQSLVTVAETEGSPGARAGTEDSRAATRPLTTGEGSAVGISASPVQTSTSISSSAAAAIRPVDRIEIMHVIHAFVTVGDAVSGWPGVVHGGILATILDEVTGYVPMLNRIRGSPMFNGAGYMTGYLNTKYHRPVGTPGVLLVTARIAKLQGRKCWIEGQVRSTTDGKGVEGPVLASCEALFIALTTEKPVL